jgi:cell shape-determining protein MreC
LKREVTVAGGASARPGIVAGVLSRPPESPYDTLLVNAGSEQGVSVGMEAFAGNASPVGLVSAVSDYFARVTLFSAPRMQVSGWVGTSSLPITLYGEGAGTLSVTISRAGGVSVGDTVYVPGPGHLPLGTVVRVDSDQSSPSVTLRVEPFINPFSIGWLELRDIGKGFLNASTTP